VKAFWKAVRDIWWERQRNTDLNILWPACKEQAADIEYAKAMFALHTFKDPAWIEFYGKDELMNFIEKLE